MIARILLVVVALFTLAACDPHDWNDPNRPGNVAAGPDHPSRAQTAEQCALADGDWRPVCMSQTLTCVNLYADGGKACTDGRDCEGKCLADTRVTCDENGENCARPPLPRTGQAATGICQVDDDPCGTFMPIEDGIAGAALAVD